MKQRKLFVISGASGVGKSTVLHKVMAARDDLLFSVSATTRPPRPHEKEGVNYYFITQPQFEAMIAREEFLEYDAHNGYYYGTPKKQLMEKLESANVLLDIEPHGAFTVREAWPDAVLIFVMPPSMEALEARLRSRGDTSEEQIRLRLARARWEMRQRSRYDHVVVNDRADACAEKILHIIAEQADEFSLEE